MTKAKKKYSAPILFEVDSKVQIKQQSEKAANKKQSIKLDISKCGINGAYNKSPDDIWEGGLGFKNKIP